MQLENDHNAYILGAGFSAEAGVPVVKDFLKKMRDAHPWLVDRGRKSEAQAIERVLEFRLKAASAAYRVRIDLENIEELFSLATAQDPEMSDDIRLAIAATIDYSCNIAQPQIDRIYITKNHKKPLPNHWELKGTEVGYEQKKEMECNAYDLFAGTMSGYLIKNWDSQQNTILTFNYDLIVEEALERLGVSYYYGLKNAKDDQANSTNESLPLYKMHGSVNWATESNKNLPKVYPNYRSLLEQDAIPEIIPPTWRKAVNEHIAKIWQNSVESLLTATRIIILGFSMPETDVHFKYLLASGLQQNISLREVIFVNIRKEQTEQRAHDLFGEDQIALGNFQFRSDSIHKFFIESPGARGQINREWKDAFSERS